MLLYFTVVDVKNAKVVALIVSCLLRCHFVFMFLSAYSVFVLIYSKLAQAVMLLTSICELLGSNPCWDTNYPKVFHDFLS
jgi:hypothetical protein